MKIKLHPLFIALGIASAIVGGLPVFLIYVLTALLHECGHIFCAARLGYSCSKISLTPYGAAATCVTDGISYTDEIKLALSGPAVNAFLMVFVAGLWWFYPVSYAYTDTVFQANAVMLVINLMPAYPLDGGRVARCLMCLILPEKAAKITLRVLSGLLAATLVLVFAFAVRNISFIMFAAFLTCSAFEKDVPLSRINYRAVKPRRGKEVKHVLLSESSTFKDALRHINSGKYLIFQFYGDGMLDEITEDELYEMMQKKSIYDKII